jgi:hypothetical protein
VPGAQRPAPTCGTFSVAICTLTPFAADGLNANGGVPVLLRGRGAARPAREAGYARPRPNVSKGSFGTPCELSENIGASKVAPRTG